MGNFRTIKGKSVHLNGKHDGPITYHEKERMEDQLENIETDLEARRKFSKRTGNIPMTGNLEQQRADLLKKIRSY